MKNTFKIVMLMSILIISACGDNKNKTGEEKTTKDVKPVDASALKIAFYVEDSIASGFEYYKSEKGRLEGKQKNFENKLASMQKELESLGKTFETKYRNNELAPVQIEQYQQRIQQKQMDIYNYQQNEGMKLEQEAIDGTKAMLEKIDAYGKEFSEKNGINILLAKKVGGQVIHADGAFDMTKDFIDFINSKEEEIKQDLQ